MKRPVILQNQNEGINENCWDVRPHMVNSAVADRKYAINNSIYTHKGVYKSVFKLPYKQTNLCVNRVDECVTKMLQCWLTVVLVRQCRKAVIVLVNISYGG